MTCGHLFNGIGGFALAAHWMGWENIMHCEIDPFCNQVMNYHFPNSYQHEDIKTTDFNIWRGKLDIITGGFPCQPYSTAGKRKGTADYRYLWPQMLRAIREIQPDWIVGENVRGLTNWNGGVVFDEVQANLEAEGYEVLPFLLPAAGVNAPHRRDRIWFVAYSISRRGKEGATESIRQKISISQKFGDFGICGIIANSESIGRDNGITENQQPTTGEKHTPGDTVKICIQQPFTDTNHVNGRAGAGRENRKKINFGRSNWQFFPTQSPVCSRNDGFPGRLVGLTFSKWRRESIKALGNAIVPQVAFQIFKAIEQYEIQILYRH